MMLSKYFSLEEFTLSQTAIRLGIDNEPPPVAVRAMKKLCTMILDPLRETTGPITISSGYRSAPVNTVIGGAVNSQHMLGEAADIIIPGERTETIQEIIRQMRLPIDQCIEEFGKWVHVSYSLTQHQRGQFLKSSRGADGRTIYTNV